MKEGWKQWTENKGIKKWFRKENLVVMVLSGVLLFIIALPTKSSDDGTAGSTDENRVLTLSELGASEGTANDGKSESKATGTDEEYSGELERRLTEILSQMAEVGEVRVMITLKASSERIVEKEEQLSRSATNESDAQGGSRSINNVETGDSTVYRTEGSASEPYVIKTLSPEIEGVLVVAEGAGNGTVNKTVTEIVQALFGVEAHKVKVVKLKE